MSKQISLSRGLYAIVDDEDYDELSRWHWYADSHGYAARKVPGEMGMVYMHRILLNFPSQETDHINANRQDNRKCNLRPATIAQNQYNQYNPRGASEYKGVSWNTKAKKWYATIKASRGKPIYLGGFIDEVEAALIYDKAAKILHGAFASLNFRGRG